MNSYLVEKLKEGRLSKGLKQSDVTRLIGIKNTTLSNYENGNTEPDMDTFLKLCHLYDLDYSELLGEAYGYSVPGCTFDIKSSDIKMISKYRDLDEHGKELVDFILTKEHDRCIASINEKPAALRIYTYMQKIAAAGNGFYFDDIPTETIEAPYMPGADFIIGVSGDSMEPTYNDGDLVYVEKRQIIHSGEVGIFMIHNECYIKEVTDEGLKSHNPKYKIIPGDESIQCIGKVLGKVDMNA